ncbi:CC_3452 family protein [Sphingomonas sp. FW199]|uniref:CC_3452 family protein n=1 Tax=unclassified Sphingomonas TaxID=196159 RepID=UPI0021A68AA9|nr:hypothetical protein [Sphingomonas sp. BGYR3]MDG5489488.1 hypothetical protein [Sphingomonas sp. BGYR3]
MIRLALLAAALVSAAAPAMAQSRAGYMAAPAAAKAGESFITRGVMWRCTDNGCVAPKGSSPAKVVCELAVREVGTLTAFAVDGLAFDAEQLAKCNAKAKG